MNLTFSFLFYIAPRPPQRIKTWGSEESTPATEKRQKHRRIRSASVGSNVVERSKKHWVGRPITREAAPKRPFNEKIDRVRVVKSKMNPPVAEDYQTADGVPFPPKTGLRKIFALIKLK